MNIAVFIKNTTHHPNYGGFETQNKVLVEELVKKGHYVTVFAPQKELSQTSAKENGVNYVFVSCIFKKFSSLYGTSKESWDNKSYEAFNKMHTQTPFDIVLGQSSWALGLLKRKSELDLPVISISHGSKIGEYQTRVKSISSPRDAVRLAIDIPHVLRAFFITQRMFARESDHMVAVSNAVKTQIIDETYIPEEKVTVINNGIDSQNILVANPTTSSTHLRVLYIGRLEQSKGLQNLLKAISTLKNEKFSFEINIVGDGPYKSHLEELSKKYELDSHVNFYGKLPYEQVLSKYADSDVFVLPTLRVEGFPMTLVEAMFAGLPIIASDIGGNSDAVVNEKTGYLIELGNVEELSQKLQELTVSPEKRAQMSSEALKVARQQFTADVMIEKYINLMEKTIAQYKKKHANS